MLDLSDPEILILEADVNTVEVLSGASKIILQSKLLYVIISIHIERNDYYHISADRLIPLILDMFDQIKLLKVYDENDERRSYLFRNKNLA